MARKGNFFHKWYYENKWNGLMSVEELGLKYQITNACMFYNSLLSCLPRFWKHLIQNSARLLSVTGSNMEQFDKIRNCIKPCKTFYNIFLKKYTERPINSQNKWEKLLNINEVNWEFVYILSNDCSLDNTLKMFQYKLLHRTIPTNAFLYKCRLVETELCAFCGETRETLLHLFCDCNIVKNIWLKIYEQLQIRCGGLAGLSGRDILLGIENVDYLYINSILLITKYYIYSCKFKKVVPSFSGVISYSGTNIK